jgi:hypothetical protein
MADVPGDDTAEEKSRDNNIPVGSDDQDNVVPFRQEMTSTTVESLILEAGQSPVLRADLMLTKEETVNGEHKFSARDCRELEKVIKCRVYAKPINELCHLIRIAEACAQGAGYEFFFLGSGPARANGFRAQAITLDKITSKNFPGFTKINAGVEACYSDGKFTVNFGRMPFLSALFNFLATALDWDVLEKTIWQILDPEATVRTVSDQANSLNSALYNYLKIHLPPVQRQRKFHSIIKFMEDHKGKGFTLEDIDDESIFTFWKRVSGNATENNADFKTYATVFKTFVRMHQVLEFANDLQALDHAIPIGPDWNAGEINPDRLSELLEEVGEVMNPLLALKEDPAAKVKFLNQREFKALVTLFESGRIGLSLPLSVMRCETFVQGQSRITHWDRRKADRKELKNLIQNCTKLTYVEKKREFQDLMKHLESVLLATLHALMQQRAPEALSLILAIEPEVDLSPLKSLIVDIAEDAISGENIVELPTSHLTDTVIDAAGDPARVGNDLANLTARAAKAFDGLSRTGFKKDEARDLYFQDGYVEGARQLLQVLRHMKAFTDKFEVIDLPAGGWVAQFDNDKSQFSNQFKVIYGEML